MLDGPGLYDPSRHLDSCGIGFVADAGGSASRALMELVLEALRRVRHRGATVADGRTGDGAGILVPIPGFLLDGADGLAMIFSRGPADRALVEEGCAAEGIGVAGWRGVPVDLGQLGAHARSSAPVIEQALLVRPPRLDDDGAEARAFRARKHVEAAGGPYVASLSFRTVTYKALCAADHLAGFYDDLRDPRFAAAFGIFHQRFSTNTEPSWERAQPFRLLCHNGEINTIEGNVNWMGAREGNLGDADDPLLHPVIDAEGSDSAMLDNVLELLVRGGRDVRHATTMLVPPAWQGDAELSREVRDFYRYHAGLVEPWDGPAALVFTDGRSVGASLDRNGLRPLRLAVAEDGLIVCSSEAGVVDLEGLGTVWRTKLGPGQIVAFAPDRGLELDSEIKTRLAGRRPYGQWLADNRIRLDPGEPSGAPGEDLTARHLLFGWTREDLLSIVRPTASHAHEPTSSMGDDAAIPPLAERRRPLFGYFRQRFAQVTNPPIDHLRERAFMSLETLLGARSSLLEESEEGAFGWELDSFLVYPSALDELPLVRLDATFGADETLREACERLAGEAADAAHEGALILVTDAAAGAGRAPIPILLATGFVHHDLVARRAPLESHPRGRERRAPRLPPRRRRCSATAPRRSARGWPSRRWRRWPRTTSSAATALRPTRRRSACVLRSRTACSRCCRRWASPTSRATAGRRSSRRSDSARSSSRPRSAARTPRSAASASASWRTTRASAPRTMRRKLDHPGYLKFRKGGEPHATDTDVVAAAHALRKAVNGGGRRAVRAVRGARERAPTRSSSATCSSP